MKCRKRGCSIALGLLAGLACAQPALAQGDSGSATLSVGITIVAPGAPAAEGGSGELEQGRIAVDPAYALDPADPLREARVERVALADGATLQVVSY